PIDINESFVFVGGGLLGGMNRDRVIIKLLTLSRLPTYDTTVEGWQDLEIRISRTKELKQEIENLIVEANRSSNQEPLIKRINEKIKSHNKLIELVSRITTEEKNKLEKIVNIYNSCIN